MVEVSAVGALLDPDGLAGGEASPSPAGPISAEEAAALPAPPMVPLPRPVQVVRFNQRQIEFVFKARRTLGEVWRMHAYRDEDVVTSHPDHVRSLFTARAEDAPSITGESPLRPIVGPNSVLTAIGPRHMRQRKLLLPAFHGEAIEHYSQMISDAAEREVDRWPIAEPLALAPRMQAITLDVIMAGIFGIEGKPAPGTPEHAFRRAIRVLVNLSTRPEAQLFELVNTGKDEPVGVTKAALAYLDRHVYAVIEARRQAERGTDILSLLLDAETEEGERLTDRELRDELLTLVLAGHETTANSLAWAFERLLRHPEAYDRLREVARSGEDPEGYLEATIHETMRSRPVIPIIGRRVKRPWQLGDYRVPPETAVLISILLVHHREDVYPDPFAFRPERFVGVKPGTYTWIPFGGGVRRCLGGAFAQFEMRAVLAELVRRRTLEPSRSEPERVMRRAITETPRRNAEVIVR
jgi:cytochrome P450